MNIQHTQNGQAVLFVNRGVCILYSVLLMCFITVNATAQSIIYGSVDSQTAGELMQWGTFYWDRIDSGTPDPNAGTFTFTDSSLNSPLFSPLRGSIRTLQQVVDPSGTLGWCDDPASNLVGGVDESMLHQLYGARHYLYTSFFYAYCSCLAPRSHHHIKWHTNRNRLGSTRWPELSGCFLSSESHPRTSWRAHRCFASHRINNKCSKLRRHG